MNDNFGDFLNEYVIDDTRSTMYLDDLFVTFQVWFKRTISDKPPSRKELQSYLEKKYGNVVSKNGKKGWIGHKIVDPTENNSGALFDDDCGMSRPIGLHY